MFSMLLPIFIEFFKYQSGQVIKNKFEMTQEQLQKSIQDQVTKILIKFFGGLICTVAVCYAFIGLFDLLQTYINTLQSATEIKIVFFVFILGAAAYGLKSILARQKPSVFQATYSPVEPQEQTSNSAQSDASQSGFVQNLVGQFVEGLNQGLNEKRKKNTTEGT